MYCENERGEKFIVELQKAKQKFFKDRSVYYSTFPVQEQAQTGEWNFELKTVYTIAIMPACPVGRDFVFEEEEEKMVHDVWLIEKESGKIFNDKLRYIYLEMPKFKKSEEELVTHFEKWLFVLKNLSALQTIPVKLQERVFEQLFKVAEIAQYSKSDRLAYEESLKSYRDTKNVIDTAFEEGEKKGKWEEKLEIAANLLKTGQPNDFIAQITGLPSQEIENLRASL